jgi:hypothetical protein
MSNRTKAWFDQLEVVLKEEAELAGLLGHNGMVGTAREFFARRVLRSILPPAVHIGSGRVIGDNEGEQSKQIDVILYDSRWPFLEVAQGVGLYFVSGVIATIEVKSTLTKRELNGALENCLSVMKITHPVNKADAMRRRTEIAAGPHLSIGDAQAVLNWELTPRTYIFAFKTKMNCIAIGGAVAKWYDARGESATPFQPFLPRLIAAPGTVAIQDDGWLRHDLGEESKEKIRRQHGPRARAVMIPYPTKRHFGWLAFHLIHTVHERLGPVYAAGNVRMPIDEYLPVGPFSNELKDGETDAIVWSGKSSSAKP